MLGIVRADSMGCSVDKKKSRLVGVAKIHEKIREIMQDKS
jgi:hypothetical protein